MAQVPQRSMKIKPKFAFPEETVVIVLRPTEAPLESEISSYANLGS